MDTNPAATTAPGGEVEETTLRVEYRDRGVFGWSAGIFEGEELVGTVNAVSEEEAIELVEHCFPELAS